MLEAERTELAEPVAKAMREAAEVAILPRRRQLSAGEIEQKAKGEVVTEADRQAEALLQSSLQALLDGARIVGEKASHEDPARLTDLQSGLVWLIDPLDGTGNFVAGEGPFAVMVALMEDGVTVASWIPNPATGTEFVAFKGQGAWMNRKKIIVAPERQRKAHPGELRGAIFTRFLPPQISKRVGQVQEAFARTTAGVICAGAEYPAIVSGKQDFALFWRTLPWDHAPGALFLAEAGGYVARPDGSDYRPGDGKFGLLAAQSELSWHAVRRVLFD